MKKTQTQNPHEYSTRKVLKGGALGVLALRSIKGKGGSLSERVAQKLIAKDSAVVNRKLSLNKKTQLDNLSRTTEYWHGTGRYQYRDGKVVDVLDGVIRQGGLLPQRDDIDLSSAMDSVSLARSRTYARAYADMHENGIKGERHGTALLWSAAFIGPLAFKIAQEEKIWKPSNRKRVSEHFRNSNSAKWYEKVRRNPTGTLGIFALGSDIEDNYPMLFGIKEGVVSPVATSASVAVHEVRADQPISFDNLSHLEVPEARIAETQAALGQAGIVLTVIAIEDFEVLAASRSFAELVSR